jgi:hypothetical protein
MGQLVPLRRGRASGSVDRRALDAPLRTQVLPPRWGGLFKLLTHIFERRLVSTLELIQCFPSFAYFAFKFQLVLERYATETGSGSPSPSREGPTRRLGAR